MLPPSSGSTTSCSPETTYLRFFSVHPELSARELERFTHVDHQNREAIVATVDDMIIGVARFDRIDGTNDAEAAFVDRGRLGRARASGTALFHRLAERAREVGIGRFIAEVLPHNRRMLDVFFHAWYPVTSCLRGGDVHIEVDLQARRS